MIEQGTPDEHWQWRRLCQPDSNLSRSLMSLSVLISMTDKEDEELGS
jgi:hypothetical protein